MTERIFEAQNKATSLLEQKGLDRGAVRLLMEYVTGKSHASLLASMRDSLTMEEQTRFWDKVDELLEGKPVQYVIGSESFYGRTFEVDNNVLIPRPETEELIHGAIERCQRLFHNKKVKVADIGTGSGAIAVTFKKEWPEAMVTATDISAGALTIAMKNAERNAATITFKEGDMTEPIQDAKWDLVLSNPPYIAHEEAELMSPTVLSFEPHNALFAEEDGLYFYRKLAESLPHLMNKPGLIGVEFGYLQGESVRKLFTDAFPKAFIEIVKDINGKDRILFCEIHE
ncbi:peptide chain release factor N(5)-glutamine methyltransferase [Sporosarcina sp. G11-34]|uniref:peptide chain release factor N(5)-glutamine methyltransferase n=1 Tax=Sporosarcina sp. G11-34 TaxID=2849605 RepID=UPI0022A91D6C|nr:peptide chain release factor N(5)-glutamine methyltransferase [Sporosarcina sp. G11-34]MCZ2258714.1 peptide chain release factor N(5)-glutamine methyltransferase [Sporosarcina sp. G11-34]